MSSVVGNKGGPYKTLKGAASVHIEDVHNVMINKELHFHTDTETTLAVATTGDGTEYQITVASAVGFAAGNFLHIEDGEQEPTHSKIISIASNVLTLDRKIDLAHPIGAEVTKAILDMASIVGTLADPIIYWAAPVPGEIWHLTRAMFAMAHTAAGDLGKFGDIPSVPNGAIVRVRTNGEYRTLANWKDAGDIKTNMYDVTFDLRSGGQGSFGTSGRWTFAKAGMTIKLDGDTGDRIEVLIQDDIDTLGFFNMKVQGHPDDQ